MTTEYGSLLDGPDKRTAWGDVSDAEKRALADAYIADGTRGIARVLRHYELNVPVNTVRGNMVRAGVRVKNLTPILTLPAPRMYNFELPFEDAKVLIIGDEQGIFRDRDLCNRVMEFANNWEPDLLVDLGDSIDNWSISRFARDPRRHLSLAAEIEDAKDYFAQLRLATPYAQRLWLHGNHEQRWDNYLIKNAPDLLDLPGMSLEDQLDLGDAWETYEYGAVVDFRGFSFTHGWYVGDSAAKKTGRVGPRSIGGSGIQGHDHTDQKYAWVDARGPHAFFVNPTLMRIDALSPDYITGIVNWTQGFSYMYFVENRWTLTTVTADTSGRFVAEGALY